MVAPGLGMCIRAQSSFTALVSTVALVGILAFCLAQVSLISRSIADDAQRMEAIDVAIAVSNDLLSNPGYNGTALDWRSSPEHLGLAEYDYGRRIVLDHVLDRGKIAFLEREGIGAVQRHYGVGNASLRIMSLEGGYVLDTGKVSGSRVRVTRLALLREEGGYVPVRLVFTLEA